MTPIMLFPDHHDQRKFHECPTIHSKLYDVPATKTAARNEALSIYALPSAATPPFPQREILPAWRSQCVALEVDVQVGPLA